MNPNQTFEARAVIYQLEIPIDAPREKVWASLVDETNAWWLPDFHMAGAGSVVSFEAKAGGQLVEHHDDGTGLLWYTVTWVKPGEQISLTGGLNHRYGGPATTMLEFTLKERGGGTLLELTDALYGRVTDGAANSLQEGWQLLMTDGLKAHAEK